MGSWRHLTPLAAVLLVGCGADDQSAAVGATPSAVTTAARPDHEGDTDKAGNDAGSVGPVVLRATMQGGEGRPRALVLQRLAEELADVSAGAVTLEITYDNPDGYDQFLDGDWDVLLANARSLDSMGVSTFDVLTLPFLVEDDDQADRVADAPVVDEMMDGLSAIDATGLMFAPVGAVHLEVAGTEPLRSLAQLHTGIRTDPPSDRLAELFAALGGEARAGLNGDDWAAAVGSGDVLAAEFPTALATVHPDEMAMATNFTMFYEFAVVMISDDALAGLDNAQRTAVDDAAAAATQRSIGERIREGDAFRDACTEGATLTAAPMSLVADVGRSLDDPILDVLADDTARHLYDAISRAAGPPSIPPPHECRSHATIEYVPPPPPTSDFPTGVYRIPGRSREQLRVSGLTNDDATGNAADYIEVTFDAQGSAAGTATVVYVRDGTSDVPCVVAYTIDPDGRLALPVEACWGGTYTWTETADGIALEAIPVDDPEARSVYRAVSIIGFSDLVAVS